MTTKLGLTDLVNGQANYLNANQTFALLNQLVQGAVVDKDLAAPPGSPADEALYIVAASATGAWSGQSGKLAFWLTSAGVWTFVTPREGMLFHINDEDLYYKYSGSAWEVFSGGGGSSTWGSITGTLADQADLQSELDDKLGDAPSDGSGYVRKDGGWEVESGGGGGMTNPMTTAADIIVGGASGAPARLAKGTAFQVLRVNSAGTALEYATPAGGGLTSFTESYNTAVPNNSTKASLLIATGEDSNIDAVFSAKGSGAILAQLPDNSSSGGNKRGSRATDLQSIRSSADKVASGVAATISGGQDNKASGNYSFSAGNSNTSSGVYSASVGTNCAASGAASVAAGAFCTASGAYAHSTGNTCVADGDYSRASGLRALTRGIYGADAWSIKNVNNDGDSQVRKLILAKRTSNATPVVITADNASPSASNQLNIPIRSSYLIKGRVSAHNQSSNDASAWEFSALMKSTTGGTVSLVGSPVATVIAQDAGASTWAVSLGVDDTLKTLTVTVTGASTGNTKFTCLLESVEATT